MKSYLSFLHWAEIYAKVVLIGVPVIAIGGCVIMDIIDWFKNKKQ